MIEALGWLGETQRVACRVHYTVAPHLCGTTNAAGTVKRALENAPVYYFPPVQCAPLKTLIFSPKMKIVMPSKLRARVSEGIVHATFQSYPCN